MINIMVLTATRAEYGLLSPIIKKMLESPEFAVKVVATGAHLSPEFGLTYKEIEEDGVEIDKKIEILLSSDTPSAISKSMGMAMVSFADYFAENAFDAMLVLGDRYETLAVCCAAMNARIPIVHLYGGETTEGAVDEAIRHAITKMSYLHFTSTSEYRKRVIQLGEAPERVHFVGAMGVENAMKAKLYDKAELLNELGLDGDDEYAVVTFHPVTLENDSAMAQTKELLEAISLMSGIKFIVTKANADSNGRIINEMFEEYATQKDNVKVFSSLGMKRYLSAIKYAKFVMGNSSSGLVEVPTFKVPTINIGDRQKGRIQGDTVINCEPVSKDIVEAMNKAMDAEFRKSIEASINPYGDGNTSDKIVAAIAQEFGKSGDKLKKKFYDVEVKEV